MTPHGELSCWACDSLFTPHRNSAIKEHWFCPDCCRKFELHAELVEALECYIGLIDSDWGESNERRAELADLLERAKGDNPKDVV